MSELASALFSIADANEFRFARFYIVCEEVPLGTPESPLIVCGLSDTLRECPNVAKTRNGMPAAAWKKYSNFASKNLLPSVYSGTFLFSSIPVILLITKGDTVHFIRTPSAALRQPCLGQPQARKLHRHNAQNNTGTHIPYPQSIASVLEQLAGLECKCGKCCKATADAGL